MGETTDQIKTHIEGTRQDLQSNIEELQVKVKTAIDWRHYFKQHTGVMLAIAFAGGALVSAAVGRARTSAA